MRQLLRLIFRKMLLKGFFKRSFKLFTALFVIKLFGQKRLQQLQQNCARSHQTVFRRDCSKLPNGKYQISYKHLRRNDVRRRSR